MMAEFLAVAALCVGVGLAVGLYVGERGRRLAAERQLVTGSPLGVPPAKVFDSPPDPESRVGEIGYSPETIERGAKEIMALAKRSGRPMSKADAMAQAQRMLNGEVELDGPGAGVPL
jgi:hypothetical protein